MPRRTDIHSILIIGSGPIVIGQGPEFDYSGVQACRALGEEGYRIVLINSNPATIMTDPQFAHATYIEPITPESVEKILKREKENGTPIDALLPTLGGQTGLNTGMACYDQGILQKYGVQMIGADRDAIHKGEDRQVFKDLMLSIGLNVPTSRVVHNMDDAREALEIVGLPAIIRPAFTLGGTGGGIAYNREEFEEIVTRGLDASPVTEVLIEQSVIGWKEYEMEVVRDKNDNCIIICSIENIDAMGVHTGDSITVAPIQTLSDKEYQKMRDASFAVIRAVGVETGGSNIQFGINPKTGEMVVIEMNPRVSRSSALASKATGYPIAKIAAKLAVGYTLDELPNPITTRKRAGRSVPQHAGSAANAVSSTPKGISSIPKGVSSIPKGISSTPEGVSSTPKGVSSIPKGVSSTPEGVSSIPESISSTPEGIRSIPESISSTPKGISSTPKGVSSTPKGLSRASDGIGSASVLKNNASSATDLPSDVSTPAQSGRPDGSNAESREDYELYTSACFEPSIDYVVIKIPRWTFEKFPDADETLTTQMKSVGEAMAIGRTFKEALQKGIRSMEVKRFGFGLDKNDKWLASERVKAEGVRREGEEPSLTPHASTLTPSSWPIPEDTLRRKLAVPSQGRLYYVRYALKMGWTIEQIHGLTHIDPWFLAQMKELTDFETVLAEVSAGGFAPSEEKGIWRKAKQLGYSDIQLASISKMDVAQVRGMTKASGARPVYKLVDTCAAEFEAATPYYYSTYETPYSVVAATPASPLPSDGKATQASRLQNTAVTTVTEDEIRLTDRPKIIIIGGGPNRIGQGIEFDYCCVQAAFAMKEMGFESVMINSNPETVSTDYDTSDLLFFEPLTHEDVLNVCERLNGRPFDDSPEIDLVDGAKPAHEAHLVQLRRYFRETGFERIACVSVTHGQPHEITSDLDVPATNYNFVDDRGELWCAYFEDRNPHSLWGFRGSHFPSNSPEIRAAMKTRFEGKLKPNKGLVKGVVVQYGGQTPLNLAQGLVDAGVPILGTPMDSLDKAGSRERFRALIEDLELKQPPNGIAKSVEDARRIAAEIGYPVMVRPSFVLGGRAMEIVSDEAQLNHYMANAIDVSTVADAPILIDKFLDNAVECDVDCIADFEPHRFWPQIPVEAMRTKEGRDAYLHREYGTAGPDGKRRQAIVIGVMEHIEEAGIHSGDSACALPPYSLSPEIVAELKRQTKELARALHVKGLMNVQYAIKNGEIYLIEVNPRASRTVPFVGKATGVAWAHLAAKVMAGATLDELGVVEQPDPKHVSVKEVVFPFSKFPGVDVILGPEMRSTGEVMGIDDDFAGAYAKAQMAANAALPTKGTVYISVNNEDKAEIAEIAKQYEACGFDIIATGGTYDVLTAAGIKAKRINKLAEGRPNIRDAMKNGQVQLLINTPTRKGPGTDEGKIRALAVTSKLPVVTTLTAAKAAWQAIAKLQKEGWSVTPLQAYHAASPVK